MIDATILQNAIQWSRTDKETEAAEFFKQLILDDPQDKEAWLGLSVCLGAPQDKILCFRRVLKIDPENFYAREALELMWARGGTLEASRTPDLISVSQSTLQEDGPAPEEHASTAQAEPVCPVCGLSNTICRVASICKPAPLEGSDEKTDGNLIEEKEMRSDVDRFAGLYSYGELTGYLSTRLVAPPEPEKPTMITPFLLILVGAGSIAASFLLASNNQPTIFGPIGAITILAGLGWIFLNLRNKNRYKSGLASWQAQKSKWDRLYYCANDDTVFDPLSGRYAGIGSFWQFLNS